MSQRSEEGAAAAVRGQGVAGGGIAIGATATSFTQKLFFHLQTQY